MSIVRNKDGSISINTNNGSAIIGTIRFVSDDKEEELFLITNKSNIPAVTLYNSANGKMHNYDGIVYTYEI